MATSVQTIIEPPTDLGGGGFAPYDDQNLPAVAKGNQHVVQQIREVTGEVVTARRCEIERDEAKIMQTIKIRAAAAGEDWYYSYPVKNRRKGTTDTVEGPSIHCADSVARTYGNCEVSARVIDTGTSWLIYARFIDYQTGFNLLRPFQQSKGQASFGGKDAERSEQMALSMGVSKAERNVVCHALRDFTRFAHLEAKNNLVEKVGKNLVQFRTKVLARLEEMGVELKRVEHTQGRVAADWVAADVARVIGQIKAVSDGMSTAREMWAEIVAEPERKTTDVPGEPPARGRRPVRYRRQDRDDFLLRALGRGRAGDRRPERRSRRALHRPGEAEDRGRQDRAAGRAHH